MRRIRLTVVHGGWVLAAVMIAISGLVAQVRPKIEIQPLVESDGVHAGTSIRLALRASLPEGLHVQSDKPRDPLLIPTVLSVDPPAGIRLSEIVYPPSTDFVQAGQSVPLAVFEQRFLIGVKVALDRDLPPGELVVPVRLRYQACDATTCYAPAREEARIRVRVVPASVKTPLLLADEFNRIRFGR